MLRYTTLRDPLTYTPAVVKLEESSTPFTKHFIRSGFPGHILVIYEDPYEGSSMAVLGPTEFHKLPDEVIQRFQLRLDRTPSFKQITSNLQSSQQEEQL